MQASRKKQNKIYTVSDRTFTDLSRKKIIASASTMTAYQLVELEKLLESSLSKDILSKYLGELNEGIASTAFHVQSDADLMPNLSKLVYCWMKRTMGVIDQLLPTMVSFCGVSENNPKVISAHITSISELFQKSLASTNEDEGSIWLVKRMPKFVELLMKAYQHHIILQISWLSMGGTFCLLQGGERALVGDINVLSLIKISIQKVRGYRALLFDCVRVIHSAISHALSISASNTLMVQPLIDMMSCLYSVLEYGRPMEGELFEFVELGVSAVTNYGPMLEDDVYVTPKITREFRLSDLVATKCHTGVSTVNFLSKTLPMEHAPLISRRMYSRIFLYSSSCRSYLGKISSMESGDATAQEKPIIGLYSILYAAAEYLGRETVPELFNELGKYKSVLKSYVACSLDNCSLLDFSSFVSLISYICFFYQKVAFQNPSSNKIALKVKEEIGAAYKATMALPISCSSKRFKQFRFTVEETKKEIDIFLLEKVKNKHSEKKKLPIPKANVSPAEEMLVDDEDRGADKRNLYDSTLSDEQVREVPDILATARELSLAGQTFLGACDYFRAIDCYTTLVNLRNTPLFLQAEACDGLANAHRSQAEVLLGGREFFCFKEAVDAAFYVYSVSEEQVGIFYSKKSLAKHNNTIHRTVVTVVSMLRDAFEHYALAIKYFRLEKRLLGELTEEDFDREAIHSAVRYFIENCRRNLAGLNELLLRFKGWSNYHLKRRNEERKFLAGEQSASTLSAQTVETRKDSIRQLKFFAGTLDDSVSPLLESTLENSVLRRKYRVLLQQLDISAGLQTPTSCAPDVSNCNDFPLLPAALPEISRKEEQRDAVAPVVALEMDASSDAEIRKMSIQIQALIPCEIMNFVQFLQENYIVRFVGSIVWQIVAASLSPENRHYIKANDYDLYLFPLPSSPDVTIEALISSLYQYPGASDIVSSGARKLIHLKLGDYKVDISVSSEIFLRQTIINNQRKRLITANSLFLDPKGVVEDAVGGIEDILYRRLRLVFSDVAQRYADDPLKMPRVIGDVVRAVFCEKPYQMADNLIKDIKDNAYHLTENLSLQPEKRGVFLATLKRYFSGFNAVYYYDYFFTSGLLSVFFPGITQLSLKQPAFFFVYNNMVRARLSLYNNLDVPVLPSFDSTLAYLVLPNILLSADATVGNWSTHPYINAHLRERWGVIEPLLRMADEEFEQWWSFYFCDHNSDFYQQESGIEVPPAVVESNLIGINPRM